MVADLGSDRIAVAIGVDQFADQVEGLGHIRRQVAGVVGGGFEVGQVLGHAKQLQGGCVLGVQAAPRHRAGQVGGQGNTALVVGGNGNDDLAGHSGLL